MSRSHPPRYLQHGQHNGVSSADSAIDLDPSSISLVSRPSTASGEHFPLRPVSRASTVRSRVDNTSRISQDAPSSEYHPLEPPTEQEGQVIKAFDWWWWWDIGAAAVSVICLGLIVGVLVEANGKPRDSWPLAIQPNSIIAVLTTAGKSALLVPIASCLSQLKWRLIYTRARPLSYLQTFDDASRGPWGSFMMFWTLPLQSKLGCALALITILSLGIDPSAQQILDFPIKERRLDNVTAEMGVAQNYSSKSFLQREGASSQIWNLNGDLPAIQISILTALAGEPFQPNFKCPSPATRCEWPEFSTLGVCSTLHNVTDKTTRECEESESNSYFQQCNYTIPLLKQSELEKEKDEKPSLRYLNNAAYKNHEDTQILHTEFKSMSMDGWLGQLLVIRHENGSWVSTGKGRSRPPDAEVFVADFKWCKRVFKGVKSSSEAIDAKPEKSTDTMLKYIDQPGLSEDVRINYVILGTPDGDETFWVASTLEGRLPYYLEHLLSVTMTEQANGSPRSQVDLTTPLNAGFIFKLADMEKLTSDIATTLTNQLRSSNPGDNKDAKMVKGTAYIREPVIVVRWEWLILPAAATFLMVILLVWNILLVKGVPLLKASVLPYLFYPLRGWKEEELRIAGVQNVEKLDVLAARMQGKMEVNEGGYGIYRTK
ncbi:hypothetical protein B0J15DRAFT_492385 [Fusarium solani]|uniref:Uncharacterized protein n=1 Tax=Fusarium solani TaxID=169388 RepID=A0A9P9HNK1_FUSSL|nr:uncharacterized protein B0J15DRAFT_492385 [Fusarium solani]KAH7260342.1 hypothetical protein B0J15DRAFT_492385 [Fusarium solani]